MSTPQQFWDYFNVADEIYESLTARTPQDQPSQGLNPLTLADLDLSFYSGAKAAAEELNLPWPPHLPTAEEYLNDHRKDLT